MDDKYLANQWIRQIQELSYAIEGIKNIQELIDEIYLYDRLKDDDKSLFSLNETGISEEEYDRCVNIIHKFAGLNV